MSNPWLFPNLFLSLSDHRLASSLPTTTPLLTLSAEAIPRSYHHLFYLSAHTKAAIVGLVALCMGAHPPPQKKWTKSSTNTSWLERARQARQCTLRRASFLMGATTALHKFPSEFHLTISTGPVLLYFYSIFAF